MEHVEINRRSWDERVAAHVAAPAYDVERLVSGERRLSGVVDHDQRYLGDITGKRVVHLQCHIGTDTLSLARLGGRVTGYDFSGASLDAARDIAARAGEDITYVEGELYEAADRLPRASFDVVYTSVGALVWLPDIRRWARTVADLLAPGGRLVVRDAHPVLMALDHERADGLLVLAEPYRELPEPMVFETGGTYVDREATFEANTTHEWNHGIGDVLGAVLGAGLTLSHFEELFFTDWQPFGAFVYDEERDVWELPPDLRDRVPCYFALVADAPS